MLTFKRVTFIALAVIILLFIVDYAVTIPLWVFVVAIFIYGSLLVYGSISIQSGFYVKALCRGSANSNQVAISFDDGPSGKNTMKILDILKENEIEATFFCIGKNIKNDPVLLKRIANENHLVGNHSESHHFFFDFFPEKRMIAEIIITNQLVKEIIGRQPNFFRPPYGVTTPILAKAIRKTKMITTGWSIRTFDTIIKDEKKLFHKVVSEIKPGDILLFHDTKEVTVQTLDRIIKIIKEKGMEIVRMDKLLKVPGYV